MLVLIVGGVDISGIMAYEVKGYESDMTYVKGAKLNFFYKKIRTTFFEMWTGRDPPFPLFKQIICFHMDVSCSNLNMDYIIFDWELLVSSHQLYGRVVLKLQMRRRGRKGGGGNSSATMTSQRLVTVSQL